MATRRSLLVTVLLSLVLFIVEVRGNAGPAAGKFRSRPRNQLKSTRVEDLPDDLFFQLSSKDVVQPSATPDDDEDSSEFNEVDWSPGKRGRDHGKKLSFADFYVSRGKKLNPDMFYVSRGKRDVVYGVSDGGRPHHVQGVLSRSNGGVEGGMDGGRWSGRGIDGGNGVGGSMKSRLFENIRDLQRIKRSTQSRTQSFAARTLF